MQLLRRLQQLAGDTPDADGILLRQLFLLFYQRKNGPGIYAR